MQAPCYIPGYIHSRPLSSPFVASRRLGLSQCISFVSQFGNGPRFVTLHPLSGAIRQPTLFLLLAYTTQILPGPGPILWEYEVVSNIPVSKPSPPRFSDLLAASRTYHVASGTPADRCASSHGFRSASTIPMAVLIVLLSRHTQGSRNALRSSIFRWWRTRGTLNLGGSPPIDHAW